MPHNRTSTPTDTQSSVADIDELLTRIPGGDRSAFSELYDCSCSRVLGLAVEILQNRALAEEVTRQVFLDVWSSSGTFDPARGSGITWLLTTTRNRAIGCIRSGNAALERDLAVRRAASDSDTDSDDVPVEHAHAHRILQQLSPVQRQALELAYYSGLSHREIAARLRLPLGTVRARLREAMGQLRHRIAPSPRIAATSRPALS
ncbi:sigma-70 family RNA polymerase sigma factor [Microbacteriaceae bacterium VKM Ac-2855]|nr:sigma-70 family RNA polymerase sigma factor [Microbacteriaceae bacterium VKM Ac-2855]